MSSFSIRHPIEASPLPDLARSGSRARDFRRMGIYSALLFAVVLGGVILRAVQLCHGHFGYPMDDSYIHMAMARSFALNGVWGVTKYGFSSSTSSPLFTLLLAAAYWLTGVHETTPLLINILLSVAVIAWCCLIFRRKGLDDICLPWAVPALVFAIPLPIMALSGMEHVLQILLVLVFVHLVCDALIAQKVGPAHLAFLTIVSALSVVTRYEDAFLIFIAGLLFFWRRMWLPGIAIGLASIAPIAIYGEIAVRHGWYFFPTSLLLKANLPNESRIAAFLSGLVYNCSRAPHILVLFTAAAWLLFLGFRSKAGMWRYEQLALLLFLGSTALHMSFARVGWYFRYEAYLVALGGLACILSLDRLGWTNFRHRWKWPAFVLGFALLATVGFRTGRAIYLSPTGVRNIYDQQYHSGLFVQKYFDHGTVVVNDIGAVSFLTDAKILDVEGLGSIQSAQARFAGQFSVPWIREWGNRENADVAILYSHFAPPEWPLVATWTIPDDWIAGRSSVGVYALSTATTGTIRDDVEDFRTRLSPGVTLTEHSVEQHD